MNAERTMGAKTSVDIDRTFAATKDRLWRMFTNPDDIAVWACGDWYDHITIDVDLRVGGVIHHRVTSRSDGSPWTFHGAYHEMIEGERLAYSFDWKTDWRDDFAPSLVAIDFSESGEGRASIHVTHSKMPPEAEESTRAHWGNFLDVLEAALSRAPAS